VDGATAGHAHDTEEHAMSHTTPLVRPATDQELATSYGARSFWGTLKAVGRWIKNHVTTGPGDTGKGIGVKGTHDIGGGGR
jgi:hypothetical protein